jgi:hypothetical protein
MEYLIKDLIEKLSEKRKKEFMFIEKYKNYNVKGSVFLASGKIIEIDDLIKDLEAMLQYNSRMK